jgi:putative hydrolase of the HAD superfamily
MYFLFDLGNTLIRLAYERVLANVCADATISRDALVELLEDNGGYRDLERGWVSFGDFYEFLVEKAGYRGGIRRFREVWGDFFDGPVPGMEGLLDRIRERYDVAFLSNSNEVHAELIPRKFPNLFHRGDTLVFSHLLRIAKPDPAFFMRALEMIDAKAGDCVFIDDLAENVKAAQSVGIRAFQFTNTVTLISDLEREELL